MLIVLRSVVFNILFYLNLVVLLLVALITLVLPRRAVLKMAETWGRTEALLKATNSVITNTVVNRPPSGPYPPPLQRDRRSHR